MEILGVRDRASDKKELEKFYIGDAGKIHIDIVFSETKHDIIENTKHARLQAFDGFI